MDQAILNRPGHGRLRGFPAGSRPAGFVHALAPETLGRTGIAVEGPRSKRWDELAWKGSPELDFAFTLCDKAAGESCPVWFVRPMTAHWGVEDPAAAEGILGAEAADVFFHREPDPTADFCSFSVCRSRAWTCRRSSGGWTKSESAEASLAERG
jgi:hypothetical protein